jgi:hypothetical protein
MEREEREDLLSIAVAFGIDRGILAHGDAITNKPNVEGETG